MPTMQSSSKISNVLISSLDTKITRTIWSYSVTLSTRTSAFSIMQTKRKVNSCRWKRSTRFNRRTCSISHFPNSTRTFRKRTLTRASRCWRPNFARISSLKRETARKFSRALTVTRSESNRTRRRKRSSRMRRRQSTREWWSRRRSQKLSIIV